MPVFQKKAMRLMMKEQRLSLFQKDPEAGEKVAALFLKFFELPLLTVIAGYWPVGSELDIRPLLTQLIKKGYKCALPCVTPQGLIFRIWTPILSLVLGEKFQILGVLRGVFA